MHILDNFEKDKASTAKPSIGFAFRKEKKVAIVIRCPIQGPAYSPPYPAIFKRQTLFSEQLTSSHYWKVRIVSESVKRSAYKSPISTRLVIYYVTETSQRKVQLSGPLYQSQSWTISFFTTNYDHSAPIMAQPKLNTSCIPFPSANCDSRSKSAVDIYSGYSWVRSSFSPSSDTHKRKTTILTQKSLSSLTKKTANPSKTQIRRVHIIILFVIFFRGPSGKTNENPLAALRVRLSSQKNHWKRICSGSMLESQASILQFCERRKEYRREDKIRTSYEVGPVSYL